MRPVESGLEGKASIVTGAGSGIGRAIAQALAARRAAVCIADINLEAARTVASEIERANGRAIAIRADVSQRAQVQTLVGETVRAFGRLDVLVNNAGLQFIAPVQEFPEEKWDS